jgi:hypothetical protein
MPSKVFQEGYLLGYPCGNGSFRVIVDPELAGDDERISQKLLTFEEAMDARGKYPEKGFKTPLVLHINVVETIGKEEK